MPTESTDIATAVSTVPKLVELLTPLSPLDRKRAIAAAMILLGESAPTEPEVQANAPYSQQSQLSDGIHPKALQWMSKNGVERPQLDHVFSIEPGLIEVIAAKLPGKSKRQQTVNAYVLCGLKSFLSTGDTGFTDKDAREICARIGCYDIANHSNYMKAFGNFISGTKDSGWRITFPGLAQAVKVVKDSGSGDA